MPRCNDAWLQESGGGALRVISLPRSKLVGFGEEQTLNGSRTRGVGREPFSDSQASRCISKAVRVVSAGFDSRNNDCLASTTDSLA